jgi:hypothetical protein
MCWTPQDELKKNTKKKTQKKKKRTPIKKNKNKKREKIPQHIIDSNHIKVQELIVSL